MALSRQIVIGVLAGLLIAGASANAQEQRFEVVTTPGSQERGKRMAEGELRLSLDEALTLALAHNINLEVSRLSLAASNQGIVAATGIFDPYTSVTFTESSSTTPATNELVGAEVNTVKRRVFNLGLSKTLATGATLEVSWDNSRVETNSFFYFLNPSYDTSLGLRLTQPLLAGFGTDITRAAIEVARKGRDISELEFEGTVISTVQQVEEAYWNLVYARENLAVARQSLKLAQDLLDQTRTRVRIGTSAPIDIVQSEATVAAREQDIIVAENAVEEAADVLKLLIGFERPEDWDARIIPVDSLDVAPRSVDLDESIATALERRVELQQAALDNEIRELNLLTAHNATKPRLDLTVDYGYAGVGGRFTDSQTGTVVKGGWSDALEQIRDRDFDQWSGTLSFTFPIGNHQAKATLAQRRFELASARQTLAAQRQGVIAEVRRAVRGLEAGAKSIAAAVKARELAERNLDAEQKKFANGMSTNYQVLQIQEDLAAAQVSELQSRVFYRQSLVVYEVAVGRLLEAMGVKLVGVEAEREPHRARTNVDWLKYSHWAGSLETTEKAESGGEQ